MLPPFLLPANKDIEVSDYRIKLTLEEITALDKRLRPAGKKEKGTLLKDVKVGCEELEKTIFGLNEAVVVGRGGKEGRGVNGSWVKRHFSKHVDVSCQTLLKGAT